MVVFCISLIFGFWLLINGLKLGERRKPFPMGNEIQPLLDTLYNDALIFSFLVKKVASEFIPDTLINS